MKFALKKEIKRKSEQKGRRKEGRKKGNEKFKILLYRHLIIDNLLLNDVNTLSSV